MITDKVLNKQFFEYHCNMNWSEMAELSGFDRHTIAKYAKLTGFIREAGVSCSKLDHSVSYWNDKKQEASDGFLLGDGSIRLRNGIRNGNYACSQKHEEMTKYFMSFFADYKPYIRIMDSYHRKLKKTYRICRGSTLAHPDITIQRYRWYSGRTKILPVNIVLSTLSVLLWYLGDGNLHRSRVRLFTNNFTGEEVEMLCAGLDSKCNIKSHMLWQNMGGKKYPYIAINKHDSESFFEFIGRDSPVKCYDYKFLA